MKLRQRRMLVLMDDEEREMLGVINEEDDVQFIDARGRLKYGHIKRINAEGLILITDDKEWHMPIKYIEHIAKVN